MRTVSKVIETDRLALRPLTVDDAAFIFELVNDPDWLRFIGDRGVRTLEDARNYILNGPVAMYERVGFGLYLVELKSDSTPIGMCGLIKREGLDDVDLGFAYLPKYRAQGYAYEAASAVQAYGRQTLGLKHIVAITAVDNEPSIRLLEKLGFVFEKTIRLPNDDEELKLFAISV
jgi:RimJ/RimL family protein N-acetyltransferase